MPTHKLFLLPGDGIGPEVMAEVEKVAAWFERTGVALLCDRARARRRLRHRPAHGVPISDADMARAAAADAILLGAVGGPKWVDVAYELRPEAGPPAAAQGSRPLRQPAPRHLPPGARRRLLAQA